MKLHSRPFVTPEVMETQDGSTVEHVHLMAMASNAQHSSIPT